MATAAPVIGSFSPDTNVPGDGVTSSNRITLSGQATPNTTINLFDGAALLGKTVVNAAGNWSFTTGTLSNATHSFTASDSDGAGNTSAPSSALTVTVDNVAPATPSISSWSPDSVNNYDYGVTNSNHLTLNGTAEANSTVNVFDNGVKIGTATTNSSGVWTFNTGVIPDGINALTVSATDAAGNSSGQTFFATHAIVDTSAPTTPTLTGGSHIGVMMEGAESSWIGFPGTKDLDYLKSHGVDLVRLPISWELMQNTLNGPLNATYLAGLEKFLDQAAQRGMQVIIELHNHGEYDPTWQQDKAAHGGLFSSAWQIGQPIGSSAVPVSSFGNFWTQLATALDGHAGVAGYDLMNEPAYISGSAWQTTAQSAIDAIRTVDTQTPIYVEGAQWSVASTWQLPWYSGNLQVTDPANKLIYEAHQYLDANSSGLYGQPFDPQKDYTNMGADLLQPWVNWLHANNVQGFLGEFGAPVTDPRWLPIVNAMLDYMQANGISGTYCNYTYKQWADISIAPENNQGAAMMELIFEHSAPSIAGFVPNNGTGNNGTTTANVLTLNGTGASFCTVKVFDNGALVGTTTSDVSGAWSLTTATLSNGLHNFTATNVDAAGNSSELSFTMAVTVTSNSLTVIDTTAPVAPTIASFTTDSGVAGDHITNDNSLTLTGTAEAGSTVKIYDGATLLNSVTASGTGAWSYTTGVLSNGAHSLSATATDAAGNTGVASTALAVTIDTTAPVSPTIVSFSNDSGVTGDHTTNDSTLTLAGTAEANSTVKIYDGATLLNSVMASGTGAWSYTTAALANGAHSLTATATDAAGNTGVASTALAVTIDTTGPVAPTITTFSTDSGVTGDHITSDNTLTLTGTAEANATVKIYDGATLLNSVTADGTGAWSYTTAALANGGHSLTATATDVAGNTGVASTALAVTVDTAAPVVTQTVAVPSNGIQFPNDKVTVTLTMSEAVTVTGTPTLTLNNGGTATYSGGSGSNTLTFSYTVGPNDITVPAMVITNVVLLNGAKINDAAGNTADLSAALVTFPDLQIDPPVPSSPVTTKIFNPDGTLHEVTVTGITGQRYTSTDTLYANGKPVSEVWTQGATVLQSETWNPDGTVHDVHYYGLSGAYSDYDVVYASNKPVSASYSNGMSQTWSYNADGSLHELVYNGISGQRYTSTDTLYANGKPVSEVWTQGATVLQSETWNPDGTVHDVHYYGLSGAYSDYDVVYANNKPVSASYSNGMSQTWSYNADGSLHEVVSNGISGQRYTSTDTLYANGKPVSEVWTQGGTVLQSETWNPDGTVHDVHYYGLSGAYSDYDVVYANNKPVSASYSNGMSQTWSYNADGSLHEVVANGISGQRYTSTDTLYANGKPVSEVWTQGATVLQSETWNADGTVHDVHYYGLSGAYSDYDVVYANNKPVSASYSNGMSQTWSYNADGSLHELVYNGISGQRYTSTDTLYANGKPVSEVWTQGATVLQSETWNPDGTVHDVHYYGLSGAYSDYDVVYANNKPVSASYSNGMSQTWSYNADGSLHEVVYNGITGQRYTSTDTLYANGKPVSEVWTQGATVLQSETWNPDGTVHDVHYYGLSGAYSDYDVVYANNKPVSASYSNGMSQTWSYNADGSLHEVVANGISGQRYTSSDTLYANGKPVSEVWTQGATVVQSETWNPDGTVHDVHYYGLSGAYSDYDVVYANNKPVSASYSNGMSQTWTYNADGSLHEVVYNGITGQRYTSTDTLYANGKPVSEVWTQGATVLQSETWNPDGTVHDVHYYGLSGAYSDYDVVYANNKPVSASYSNGMSQTWSYNADGSSMISLGNVQGGSYTSSANIYDPNSSARWSSGGTGDRQYQRHPDIARVREWPDDRGRFERDERQPAGPDDEHFQLCVPFEHRHNGRWNEREFRSSVRLRQCHDHGFHCPFAAQYQQRHDHVRRRPVHGLHRSSGSYGPGQIRQHHYRGWSR